MLCSHRLGVKLASVQVLVHCTNASVQAPNGLWSIGKQSTSSYSRRSVLVAADLADFFESK